jgi:hypothetical protein
VAGQLASVHWEPFLVLAFPQRHKVIRQILIFMPIFSPVGPM